MSNDKVDVPFDNDRRLQAILLLGAADKLGHHPMVVETTMGGFRVPEDVKDLAFSDEPSEEELAAKKAKDDDDAAREAHAKREAEAQRIAEKELAAKEKAEQKRLDEAGNTVSDRQGEATADTSLPTGPLPSDAQPTNVAARVNAEEQVATEAPTKTTEAKPAPAKKTTANRAAKK